MEQEQLNLMLHMVWLMNQEDLISEEERRKAEAILDDYVKNNQDDE